MWGCRGTGEGGTGKEGGVGVAFCGSRGEVRGNDLEHAQETCM